MSRLTHYIYRSFR